MLLSQGLLARKVEPRRTAAPLENASSSYRVAPVAAGPRRSTNPRTLSTRTVCSKRDGDHVASVHDTACRRTRCAIHPHIAGVGEGRGNAAGANQTRVPQPPVDRAGPLRVDGSFLAALLRVSFKLRLERPASLAKGGFGSGAFSRASRRSGRWRS